MNGLSVSKLNEQVTITCYRQTEKKTRREALEFYYEGMLNSEGSEHERYETIFFQLLQGRMTASDQIPMYQL
ncbi:MAG: hypothetical protein IJ570_01165 [Prevotella sp.]|nr:hypothetical protein [Prevotella sp.]